MNPRLGLRCQSFDCSGPGIGVSRRQQFGLFRLQQLGLGFRIRLRVWAATACGLRMTTVLACYGLSNTSLFLASGLLGKTWRAWSRMACPRAFCLVGRAAQPVASVQSPSELATTPTHFRSEGVSFWAGEGAVQKILGEPCGILRCLPGTGLPQKIWVFAQLDTCDHYSV